MDKKPNKGGISDADLERLKKDYPNLKCGSIEDLSKKGGARLYFYFVPPTEDQVNRALTMSRAGDVIKSQGHFHTQCMVWQQAEVQTNGYFEKNVFAMGKLIGESYKIPEGKEEDF